ncbi:hypothetical protein [Propionivibrio sp.]|uniref:hypothetical protein n=1 Tax=Propionivibrio sp. TaxID=2212460 RepID=UPI0039E2EB0F
MFDPWTATFEEAQEEQKKLESSGKNGSSPVGPLYQFGGACNVVRLKDEIDKGDGFAVLAAIRECVTHGLVAPDWLAFAFNRRYDNVNMARVGSWDDPKAFGRPYPKGTNLAARRKARVGRLAVWLSVVTRRKTSPETPIDKGLFEEIGKALGFGATLAERYYYEQKKLHILLFGKNSNAVGMNPTPTKKGKIAGLLKKSD